MGMILDFFNVFLLINISFANVLFTIFLMNICLDIFFLIPIKSKQKSQCSTVLHDFFYSSRIPDSGKVTYQVHLGLVLHSNRK